MKIIKIKAHPLIINNEAKISLSIQEQLKVGFKWIFQYNEELDSVAFHALVRYINSESSLQIMDAGVTVIAEFADWKQKSHRNEDILYYQETSDLVNYAMAFLSGYVFKGTEGTLLNSSFIPLLNTNDILKEIIIEEIK